jgi:hypothetical protein
MEQNLTNNYWDLIDATISMSGRIVVSEKIAIIHLDEYSKYKSRNLVSSIVAFLKYNLHTRSVNRQRKALNRLSNALHDR